MTDTPQKRINAELRFHKSLAKGLSKENDMDLWARSAGTIRGLTRAKRCFDDTLEDPGAPELRRNIKEHVEEKKQGIPLMEGPDSIRHELDMGILCGLCRAYVVVSGQGKPLSVHTPTTGTKRLKWWPEQHKPER